MENTIREAFEKKDMVLSTRINSTWPVITEIVGSSGIYDYIEFLAEYAPFDHYDLEVLAMACELHNIGSLIKVDYANRIYVAQKALASGFQGVLFTDHTKADEVKETIRGIRAATPELGGKLGYVSRRWIRNATFSSQQEYAKEVSKTVIGFMIEKKEEVENIEEICKVPGVDFVQFGPADYSMNCGYAKNSKEVKEAEKHVIKTALKNGVQPRVEITQAQQAQPYLEMGVTHFSLGTEVKILKEYWNNEGSKLLDILRGK